jgi:hypothetical protein
MNAAKVNLTMAIITNISGADKVDIPTCLMLPKTGFLYLSGIRIFGFWGTFWGIWGTNFLTFADLS